MFRQFLQIEVDLNVVTVILNDYVGPKQDMVNLCILMMKQFIYAQKCMDEIPTFQLFMNKLSYYCLAEKVMTKTTKEYTKWTKRWGDIF